MGTSAPRSIFGVHSVSPYSRLTGKPYGFLRVLKSSSLEIAGENIPLMGGSNKFPWHVEDGSLSCEMSLSFGQYEDFVYELFLGTAPTQNAAETAGNVSTLTNKYGTSLMHATTGIASVSATSGSEANLKFNKYVIEAVTSTTVNIFGMTDIDFGRGSNATFKTDALKINTSPLSITSGGATVIAELGLTLTGGSGTIGMTAGDTAEFEVRPINASSSVVTIGNSTDSIFPEFGCMVLAQRRSNGQMTEIDVFRAKSLGMPIKFETNAWSESEVKVTSFLDEDKGGIFKIRHVKIIA